MTRRAALAALALVPLAACGRGASVADGPRPTAPVTTTPVAPASTPAARPVAATATAERRVPSQQFWSPSGSTTCFVSRVGAVCEVAGARWDLPPVPRDCDLDWGGMVEVTPRGTATMVCHSDTGFGPTPSYVLGYGQTITRGDFRCASARTGMTCENVRTRHGFTVSRERYALR